MKKTFTSAILIMLFATSIALADGIPVTPDKKEVRGDYTQLNLDDQQIRDVETQRKVTLRPEQKAVLERIAGGPLADITVYSSRYNMCTCFQETAIAVWTKRGVLQFPHSWLFTRARQEEREKELAGSDEPPPDREHTYRIVVFDSYGDMYVDGKKMTVEEVKGVVDVLSKSEPKDKTKRLTRSIIFDPPIVLDETTERKVLKQFYQISEYCNTRGVTIQDDGVEEERFVQN